MKRSVLHDKALFFFVLISISIVQGMESPSKRIKKIKDVCTQLPVRNWKLFNLKKDSKYLPLCSTDEIPSVDSEWVTQDENSLQLIKLNKLDGEVECVVMQKLNETALSLNEVELAHKLAEEGKITDSIALMMLNEFLKTDIMICGSNLKDFFSNSFPEKILAYGNHDILYGRFMDGMIQNYSFELKDIINHRFCMSDFNLNISSSENSMCNIEITRATMDDGEEFFVLCNPKNVINIINLKTRIILGIVVPIIVEGLVFKKGNVTSLGILDTSCKIYELSMPLALLRAEVSLQQLGALVYCRAQANKKITESVDCMGYTVFESEDCGEEKKLIKFIEEKLQEKWIPPYLSDALKRDSKKLYEVALLRSIFVNMAQALNMTREQVAIDLYINFEDVTWAKFNEKYTDVAIKNFIGLFGWTFLKKLYSEQ